MCSLFHVSTPAGIPASPFYSRNTFPASNSLSRPVALSWSLTPFCLLPARVFSTWNSESLYIRQSIWTLLGGLNYLSAVSKTPVIHSPWLLEHLGEMFSLNIKSSSQMNFSKQNGQIPMRPGSPVFCGAFCYLCFSFLSIARAEAQAHRMLMCPIEDSRDGYQLVKNIFAETLKSQTFCLFC